MKNPVDRGSILYIGFFLGLLLGGILHGMVRLYSNNNPKLLKIVSPRERNWSRNDAKGESIDEKPAAGLIYGPPITTRIYPSALRDAQKSLIPRLKLIGICHEWSGIRFQCHFEAI